MAPVPTRSRARGFTYLGLLFVIALMSLLAAAAGTMAGFVSQRERERELLFVGRAYRTAIDRYREAHKGQAQPFPKSLSDLLGDSGPQSPRRYLRKLYADPMTGGSEWGIVKTAQGGIIGVYSLSTLRPIRSRSPYPADDVDLLSARSYRDWRFIAAGGVPVAPPSSPLDAPKPPPDIVPRPPVSTPDEPEPEGPPPPQWPDGHPPVGG